MNQNAILPQREWYDQCGCLTCKALGPIANQNSGCYFCGEKMTATYRTFWSMYCPQHRCPFPFKKCPNNCTATKQKMQHYAPEYVPSFKCCLDCCKKVERLDEVLEF